MSEQRRTWLAKQRFVGVVDGAVRDDSVSPDALDVPRQIVDAVDANLLTRSTAAKVYAQDRLQDKDLLASQERREYLYQQAQTLRQRDPEAAAFAFAQLAALDKELDAEASTEAADTQDIYLTLKAQKPLDPARLYARLAKYYRFSDSEMRHMPMKRLLMYLREMDIQIQEEKDAFDAEMKKNGNGGLPQNEEVDEAYLAAYAESFAARPIPWQRPIVD